MSLGRLWLNSRRYIDMLEYLPQDTEHKETGCAAPGQRLLLFLSVCSFRTRSWVSPCHSLHTELFFKTGSPTSHWLTLSQGKPLAISGRQTEMGLWHHGLNFAGHPFTSLVLKPLCSPAFSSLYSIYLSHLFLSKFTSAHSHLSPGTEIQRLLLDGRGEREEFREKTKSIFWFHTYQVPRGLWASILKLKMQTQYSYVPDNFLGSLFP